MTIDEVIQRLKALGKNDPAKAHIEAEPTLLEALVNIGRQEAVSASKSLVEDIFGQLMTITTSHHGYNAGDVVVIQTSDMRWWRRLWCFVTRQPAPVRTERMTIKEIVGDRTLALAPACHHTWEAVHGHDPLQPAPARCIYCGFMGGGRR